jgi:glycosyltransferase involved in cell wall biosynthesis
MKIIFVLRMFSGLIDSIQESRWKPRGVPAIYKLIEGLSSKGVSLDVLLLCKTKRESKNIKGIKKIEFKELNVNFHVFMYHDLKVGNSKLRQLYNDFIQFGMVLFKFVLRKNYDLAYIDRVNIIFAAVISFLKVKTIVRFLGIADLRRLTNGASSIMLSPFIYLSLKMPYSLVLCTEDGSPSKNLFSKYLNRKTPYKIVLNGVDKRMPSANQKITIRSQYNIDDKTPIILFVGRLVENKGAGEFVDTLIRLKRNFKIFFAVIICGGDDYTGYYEKVYSNGLQHQVAFEKSIEHGNISCYYEQSDIYVSLNKYGNLSNTVLEAMIAGKCIIMLGRDERTHVDESTERLVPSDACVRINRHDIVNVLYKRITEMIDDPEIIKVYSTRMKYFANGLLFSWDRRISYEIDMIQRVCNGEPIR